MPGASVMNASRARRSLFNSASKLTNPARGAALDGAKGALNPSIAELFAGAVRFQQSGRLDEALDAYERILALNPHLPEVHYNRGVVFLSTGKFESAEASYRRVIALNPDFPEAHNNLGELLRCFGRLDESEKLLRRAISLKQPYAEALSNLGNTLKEKGRLSEAEVVYQEAIAHDPQLPGPYNNLGCTLLQLGRVEDAEKTLHRAIALKPDFAEAHHNLGLTLKHSGRFAAARRSVEQAIELAPLNASFFLSLSELKSFAVGDTDLTAMEGLARNLETLPVKQQIDLHFALAKAYEDVRLYDDAFCQLLAGNTLKRQHIAYDEPATLALFDRIQKVFTGDLMRRFPDAGDLSFAPVFIVGMPRSGSTLIEQILASHPGAFGAGELPNFGDAVTGIRSDAGHVFPDVMSHISREDLRRVGASYVADIVRLAPTAKCIIDKMPSNFLYLGLIHLLLPNARIIHAVRDSADTCVSCFSKQFTTGLHHTYDLAELGRYYAHYQALMQHWHRVLPKSCILDVHYEDVVADLEGQARRITAYCGLDWNPRCLAFHETERPIFTASSTQVRRPLYRHAIGRAQVFKQFLTPLLAGLSSDETRHLAD